MRKWLFVKVPLAIPTPISKYQQINVVDIREHITQRSYRFVEVSRIMAPKICFEDEHISIRNNTGWFCEMSFLKAGLYCNDSGLH